MGGVWMEKAVLQILNMSLMGAYCIVAVLLVRLLLKKQPKIFAYVLWSIVLFRLICPISFESPFSAFHMTDSWIVTSQGLQEIKRIDGLGVWMHEKSGERKQDSFSNSNYKENNTKTENNRETDIGGMTGVNGIVDYQEVVTNAGREESVGRSYLLFIAGIVWITGICGMLIYAVISAALLRTKLQMAEKQGEYYVMEQLETPLVFGVIRPQIYLPAGLSEQEIPYVLEHEYTHIRRRDYLVKSFAFLVLCVHWFNPLAWLAFSCMGKDMEMSCDEAVLKKMGSEIKKDYSASLLSLACGRRFLNGSPLAFGEGEVKGRIKNVLNYKKPGIWGIILAVLAIVVSGFVLISNPKNSGKEYAALPEAGTNSNLIENLEGDPGTGLPVYQADEEDKVRELLASYGTFTFEDLKEGRINTDDVIVFSYLEESNLERWNQFYERTKEGKKDAVVHIHSTIEGDPILYYVSYQDGSYYLMQDYTRDSYSSGECYSKGQWPFLNKYVDSGYVSYYLTVRENITYDEIMASYLSSTKVPGEPEEFCYVFSYRLPYANLLEAIKTVGDLKLIWESTVPR